MAALSELEPGTTDPRDSHGKHMPYIPKMPPRRICRAPKSLVTVRHRPVPHEGRWLLAGHGASDGVRAGDGRIEKLATASRTKSVAESGSGVTFRRRNRSRVREEIRRLNYASPKILRSSSEWRGQCWRLKIVSIGCINHCQHRTHAHDPKSQCAPDSELRPAQKFYALTG